MANRFPLIVNLTSQRLEELMGGDNLNLTENGIVADNTLGVNGQFLKSTGTTVVWDNAGDVYLTNTQTLTNKTLSGLNNTFTNIPNNALVNSTININGESIPLGGSVNTLVYTASANGGLKLSGTAFSIKNSENLIQSQIVKWDSINNQLTNSNIQDNGTTVTVTGNFKVGATTLVQNGAVTITMPATTGTLIASGDTGTVTNQMLAGSILPSKLTILNGRILIGNNSNTGTAVELTGDATITNSGALAISANAISFSKLQQSAAAGLSVIGRNTNSTGNFAEITANTHGHILRLFGDSLEFGQIIGAGITANTITFDKLQQSASTGLSVIGRSANNTGNFAEIVAGTNGHVLRLSGTSLGFGEVATAGIANNAVTYTKIQNVTTANRLLGSTTANANVSEVQVETDMIADNAVSYSKIQNISDTNKLLGRSSSGSGDIEEIDCTAAGRALIDDIDSAAQRITLGLGTLSTQNSSNVTVGKLNVTGDLTVSGTTTTLNTEVLEVKDNEIILNSTATGIPSLNAGIEVERGSSTNVKFIWNETTDRWTFTNNGTDYYNLPINVSELNNDSGYLNVESDTLTTVTSRGNTTTNDISVGNLTATSIISSGNIGIGTTNPQYKLDVLGDINFTGTFYQNGSQFVASRWTTGTGDNIYRLSGNVGIGTTNPTEKLQVNGNINLNYGSSTTASSITWSTSGTANVRLKTFGTSNSNASMVWNTGNLISNPTSANSVYIGAWASPNASGTSNVSIGAGCGYVLTTGIGNVFVGQGAAYFTTGSDNTFIGSQSGGSVTSGSNNTILGKFNGNSGGLDIRTSNNNVVIADGSGNIRLYANSSGNIGIGTTNPQYKLDVLGDIKISGVSNLKQITETVANNFSTSLTPVSDTLTIDASLGTVILGNLSSSVTTWAFTNVSTDNSKATTITVIIDGDTTETYGDACSVNGSAVTGGIKWSGGSAPTSTANFDVISFTIIKDSAGTINVFGSGTSVEITTIDGGSY